MYTLHALKRNAHDWLSDHDLAYLGTHLPLVLLSWALFTILSGLSRHLGPFLFPSVFRSLAPPEMKRLMLSWPHHMVSLVHAIIICVLAIVNASRNELVQDRVWGYSEGISRMIAVTMGYFLWDLKVSIHYWHLYGHAFLIHAIMALSSFLFTYTPFLQFYVPYFLLFELSTIFINAHWFMNKMKLNGSRLQKINDVILIILYFIVRIVFADRDDHCNCGGCVEGEGRGEAIDDCGVWGVFFGYECFERLLVQQIDETSVGGSEHQRVQDVEEETKGID